jgi:ribosomal protein L21E
MMTPVCGGVNGDDEHDYFKNAEFKDEVQRKMEVKIRQGFLKSRAADRRHDQKQASMEKTITGHEDKIKKLEAMMKEVLGVSASAELSMEERTSRLEKVLQEKGLFKKEERSCHSPKVKDFAVGDKVKILPTNSPEKKATKQHVGKIGKVKRVCPKMLWVEVPGQKEFLRSKKFVSHQDRTST